MFYSFSVETEQNCHDMTLGQGQNPKGPWKNGKIKFAFVKGKSALKNEFLNHAFFNVYCIIYGEYFIA